MKIKNLFSILILSSTLIGNELKVGDTIRIEKIDNAMFLFSIKNVPNCPKEKIIFNKVKDEVKTDFKIVNEKVEDKKIKEIVEVYPIKRHYIINKVIKICKQSDKTYKLNYDFRKEWKKNIKKDKK